MSLTDHHVFLVFLSLETQMKELERELGERAEQKAKLEREVEQLERKKIERETLEIARDFKNRRNAL